MVRRVIDSVHEFGERTVKVKWVVPAYILIALIAFGLFRASVNYSTDQREESERLAAEAQYAGELASWENARDERSRCEQRVESRDQLRDVFLATYDLISELNPDSEFAVLAAALLDDQYPSLDAADCPLLPPRPIPPFSMTGG